MYGPSCLQPVDPSILPPVYECSAAIVSIRFAPERLIIATPFGIAVLCAAFQAIRPKDSSLNADHIIGTTNVLSQHSMAKAKQICDLLGAEFGLASPIHLREKDVA